MGQRIGIPLPSLAHYAPIADFDNPFLWVDAEAVAAAVPLPHAYPKDAAKPAGEDWKLLRRGDFEQPVFQFGWGWRARNQRDDLDIVKKQYPIMDIPGCQISAIAVGRPYLAEGTGINGVLLQQRTQRFRDERVNLPVLQEALIRLKRHPWWPPLRAKYPYQKGLVWTRARGWPLTKS